MTAYVSLPELKAYLGNFVSNDSAEPEVSDEALQKLLDDQCLKIRTVLKKYYRGVTFPTPAGTVEEPTWIDLFLEVLNLDYPVCSILSVQAIKKFNLSKKQSDIYEKFASERFNKIATDQLVGAINSYINEVDIDTTPFIDTDDIQLTSGCPNLTLTDSTNPTLDQVTRFCLRESAWIRAVVLSSPNYETTVANLDDDQLGAYQSILVSLVAPQITRINLSYYPQTQIADYTEKSLLDKNPENIYSALNLLDKLQYSSEYHSLFLD